MSFQTSVNVKLGIGVVGDFADINPRAFVNAGAGGLVSGAAGLIIGRFAWLSPSQVDPENAPAIANNFGIGAPAGIVHRNNPGLITTFLSETSLTVPQGFPISLMSAGGIFVKNEGTTQALFDQKAYAAFTTGAISFGPSGSPTTASATTSAIAAGTAATFTGSITGNVLTASSVTNTIYPGAIVSGGTVASNTKVLSQLSGTTGGAGTYAVDVGEQTVASASLTATPYVLDTTGGTVTGTITSGSVIQSSGTATGTVVGMAVYTLNGPATGKHVVAPVAPGTAPGTAVSGTVVLASNYETKFYARSSGAAGELVKISSHALG